MYSLNGHNCFCNFLQGTLSHWKLVMKSLLTLDKMQSLTASSCNSLRFFRSRGIKKVQRLNKMWAPVIHALVLWSTLLLRGRLTLVTLDCTTVQLLSGTWHGRMSVATTVCLSSTHTKTSRRSIVSKSMVRFYLCTFPVYFIINISFTHLGDTIIDPTVVVVVGP